MKKVLSFLAAIVLLGAFATSAWAYYNGSVVAPSGQTIYYKISSTQTTTISFPGSSSSNPWGSYTKPTGALVIPDSITYNGTKYPVTSIDYYAFYYCSGLTSVIIPNSVTSIDEYAFYGCSGLTSVTIPNSVTSIGNSAFYQCTGLTSVTIPSSVTSIGNSAFSSCSSLTSVTIPSSVTSIGNYAFSSCTGLTSIIFNADSCIYAGYAGGSSYPVFDGCSNLTSITFGINVKCIPSYLCYGCSGLTSITIPDSVTLIGNSAFSGCSGLTSVTIGSSVTSIGDSAFYNCSGLTSVTIPNSVTLIGNSAFRFCSSMDTVYMMPATPPSLGSNAFYNNASGRVFILAGCTYDNYYTTVSSNPWYYYRNNLRTPTININVNVLSSNTAHGTANVVLGPGNATVRCDSTVVVQATANSDYHFDHWSNGSTANPDTVALTGDITITAYFIGLTVTSSDNTRGSATHTKIGDHLERITATPNTGYHFDHWSNGSTANPATITLTGDSTVTAYFIGLTVTSSDNTRGSATHTKIGDHLERITATPNTGYHFDHWSNGSTANPATITLTGDSTVTAYFERNTYNLTVNVNNTSLGTVATPDGTSALYQDTLIAVATPIEHYHVASWQGQGIVATSADKDTVWVQMLSNRTLTCNFAIDTHTVAATASDIARGSVSGGGNYAYGTPCTVEATAYTGYTFQSWSNGVTANPYTFAVMEDVELTAIFVSPDEQTYTVTVSVNDPAMGSATVNGNATASVMSGTEVTLAATPNSGYHFVRWNDNNTDNPRTVTVTSNMSFTAYFEADGGTEGIEEIDASNIKVYANDGRIVVEGTTDEVRVYDMMGRMITHSSGTHASTTATRRSPSSNLEEEQMVFNVPTSGVYLIKVGILPAKKVVVMKR